MYIQGDRERELDLPVTPFCDRFNMSVAKVRLLIGLLFYLSNWVWSTVCVNKKFVENG